jgi:cobalt-zinc-cadmium efflux system outer membrane protein
MEDKMKRITVQVFIQSALLLFIAIHAVNADSHDAMHSLEKLELPNLIRQAIQRNPDIIAAHNKWLSAQEIIEAHRALPDPQFSYTHFLESVETRVGPQKNIYGLKQKIPFYGKRDLKAEIAAKEAEALKASYEAVTQEIVRQVKIAFYDLFYLSTIINITHHEKEILKRFEQTAMIKYETGKGNQQNVLKVQVEINRLKDRVLSLVNMKQTTATRLNVLLDRPPDHPLGELVKPEFRDFFFIEQDLVTMARENRPELKSGSAWIEKSNNVLNLAKKDYYPDLTIGANYIDVDNGPLNVSDNGKDASNIMFSINIPLWQQKRSSKVESASKMVQAQQHAYQSLLNRTMFEIEDNLFKIQTARQTFQLYKNALIPQAEQSVKSAEAGYITGIGNFLDLLDAERVLLNIQFGYWKSYTDYLKRIADIERAVGLDLTEILPEEGTPGVREE